MHKRYQNLLILFIATVNLLLLGFLLNKHNRINKLESLPPLSNLPVTQTLLNCKKEKITQIIMNNHNNNTSMTLLLHDNNWVIKDSDYNIEQSFVYQLLDVVDHAQIEPLITSTLEVINLNLKPLMTISFVTTNAQRDLIICQPTASHNAHYAYFLDSEEKIFLIDVFTVETIMRPFSSYYAILLPVFNTDNIQILKIKNNFGSIHFVRKSNLEFFSQYEFIEPFPSHTVDQERLNNALLNLWKNRTPINIMYNYHPQADDNLMDRTGLTNPQATLEVIHHDQSQFTIAIGLPADNYHFYARELTSRDIWLLPSDLSKNILELQAFSIASRSLFLPNFNEFKRIQIKTSLNEQITLVKNSSEYFLLNNQTLNITKVKNLYELLISLQYETIGSKLDTSKQEKYTYEITWDFYDKPSRHIVFYPYNQHQLSVVINNEIQPFLIGEYQIKELWQLWQKSLSAV